LELLQFASDYYHHPLGEVVMSSLPARLRTIRAGTPRRVAGQLGLTPLGDALDLATLPARAVVKRRLLERLKAGPLPLSEVRAHFPRAARAIKELTASGCVVVSDTESAEPRHGGSMADTAAPPTLTAEQAAAVERISESRQGFQAHLLLGVAGSGKTEVYLHAISAVLDQGRQALVLVPEIALTPQLEALVRARFPTRRIACLHSGLNEGERLAHWLAAQSGHARIVLGTRLAVFTPMPELGMVVVDEEHDASFKQAEGFRYSARDLAVVRARQRSVPVVLGSATPALETYHNAVVSRYALHTLTRRIGPLPPTIECLDTRSERP